jgi:hypothetical protein
MGFISSLTGRLIRIGEELPVVNEILMESEGWEDYLQGDFANMVYLESKPLGGSSRAESSDEDENPIEQVVSKNRIYFKLFGLLC